MCGIIGVIGSDNAESKVLAGLLAMKNRGRDGAGIYSEGKCVTGNTIGKLDPHQSDPHSDGGKTAIGHILHSMVGYTPQPIVGKGVLSANCEIYNWKELAAKEGVDVKNDAELILKLIDRDGPENIERTLEKLDGSYAFSYTNGETTVLCRDILGIKPLWYSTEGGFFFASERKALIKIGISRDAIIELNPRTILSYRKGKISEIKRDFFKCLPEHTDIDSVKKHLKGLLVDSVAKRIPDQKVGILFSGGIDSTMIAKICQDLGIEFTCYTAAFESEGMKTAEDLVYSKKVADHFGFKLKSRVIRLDEAEKILPELIPLIEDTNVVKAGVGLTFYVACQEAKKDGMKVLLSGLGSEEIFAGYERHKNSTNINKECISGLLKIYERDLYRDDVITMDAGIELRLPFLDRGLVDFAVKIPGEFKLDEKQNKKILREVAEEIGVPNDIAQRKKKAAQYGSNFDKALEKLAKKNGFKLKADYLDRFYSSINPKLAVLFSGGKDSCYSLHIMKRQNYPIKCLITIRSENPDSFMFHTPAIDMTKLQADAIGIPLLSHHTSGEKEKELDDLHDALRIAQQTYGIEGIVTGALFSNYQRERIEKVADSLGLKVFSPLWHVPQEKEMTQLLDEGFKFILTGVAAEGLDKSWLGREITKKDIEKLEGLNKKYGLNIAGEGGEFESLVLDGPIFNKRIILDKTSVVELTENSAKLSIISARLEKK